MQNFKLNDAMANMLDLDRIVDFYCIAMEIFKVCRAGYNLNVHEIKYEDLNDTEQCTKQLTRINDAFCMNLPINRYEKILELYYT